MIQLIQLLDLAGVLAAFFLAMRVVALDRRALRAQLASWVLLLCTIALLAVMLALELASEAREAGSLAWAESGVETALAASLMASCYFLYVRERGRLADLYETAEDQQRRLQRVEAILELGDELRAAAGVDAVAQIAAGAVERRLAFRETALYLADPADDGVFFTAAAVGSDPEYDAVIQGQRIPRPVLEGVLHEEFRHGGSYFIDHSRYEWTAEELRYFPPGEVDASGPGSFHRDDAVFAPLVGDDGRIIGMFDVYDPADGRVPDAESLQLLGVLAAVTAAAVAAARHRAELERLAITDGLTGLSHHRHFQEVLEQEVARAERYGLAFSLLMMDLDHFKAVNDRFGHQRGDEALKAVAAVLRESARASDFVARYGGEEFVMILPGTSAKQATALAERIANGVRGIVLGVPDSPRISCSIGLADFPGCGRDRESLIAAADAALLFAKRSGRDMIADFTEVSLAELDQGAMDGLAARLENADIETIETLAAAIDQRDAFAGDRAGAVARAAAILSLRLELSEEERDELRMAAMIYDVGKLGIPVEVLNRRGELSPADEAVIRSHPAIGKRLLESATRLTRLLPAVLHHHERWDGAGYPDGLAGEQIPFAARVIAICDSWQAMVTDRPYRPALTQEAALAELKAGAGTQFDPALVAAFVASLKETGGAAG